VVDGVTGILVPPADPPKLAEAIASLISDPDRAVRLASAGRQRLERYFTADRMILGVNRIYEEVMARGES